ncbi:DUF6542 domain-containing protein [Marinactinospora thermotolerans]|uniref:DUF6542 domain-containing protein n=1 Tax=Marinactinospora thermotolerans TaxID=531310 RepID=UPI003D8B4116
MPTRNAEGSRPARPARARRGGHRAVLAAAPRGPVRLTARGALLGIVFVAFGAALLDSAVGLPVVNGAGFVVAGANAALFVRREDLLTLSVSPPLAYFVGALAAEIVLSLGGSGFARSVAIGLGTRLAEAAPWLFCGTILVLVLALLRGMAQNVRDLSAELNGRRPRTHRDTSH